MLTSIVRYFLACLILDIIVNVDYYKVLFEISM